MSVETQNYLLVVIPLLSFILSVIQPQFSCLSFTVFVWSSLLSRGISLVVEIENLLKSLRTHLKLQSVLVTLKAWNPDVWHNLLSHKIKLSGLSLREKICFPINLRLSTPASSRHSRLSCITTQLAAALRPPMAGSPITPHLPSKPPPSEENLQHLCHYSLLFFLFVLVWM